MQMEVSSMSVCVCLFARCMCDFTLLIAVCCIAFLLALEDPQLQEWTFEGLSKLQH